MEFGKHIGKGLWGSADKALPAVYGIAFMFLVIRVLPVEEYGAYFLVQNVFMIVSSLAFSFTVQPMLKYVAEGLDAKLVSSTAFTMMALFVIPAVGLVLLFARPFANLLDAHHAERVRDLFMYLPLMFVTSVYRVIASGLLQAKLKIRELFYVDAVYFGSSLFLIVFARYAGMLTSAVAAIHILVIASLLASIVAFILTRGIAVSSIGWHGEYAKKIFDFGKYGVGGTIGNVVQTQFDTFFVSMYGGVTGVAVYGVAKNFTRLYDMYSQVIQMLVLPASSILQGRGEEKKLVALVEKSICFSFYAILPVILLFGIFPQVLFRIFYGTHYESSIPVLRILSLTGIVIPFGAVLASTLYGIGKIKIGFILSIVSLVLSIALYYLLGALGGMYGIIWALVLIYVILGIIGIIVLRRFIPFTMTSIVLRTKDILTFIRNRRWILSGD